MRRHAQNNKTHEYLYTSAKRYAEQNNISAAKAELKELETYAPHFGDPEKLHETIQSIEWEASKPIRDEEARRAQEIAAAEAKKKTDASLNNIILSVFLLPSGLAGIVGMLTQSITLATCIAVIIGIILRIFFGTVLRKPHTPNSTLETKFIAGAIFSIGLAVLVTWYASTFDYNQLYGGLRAFDGEIFIGRQINFGFFIGIFVLVALLSPLSKKNSLDSKWGILMGPALSILSLYITGSWLGPYTIHLGFGFGWYWTFIAIALESISTMGIISLLPAFERWKEFWKS